MDVEKLQIQRAFHDLIKELESLKDTTDAIKTYQDLVQKMSDSIEESLKLSESNFARVSNYFDNYKDWSELSIDKIKQQAEAFLKAQERSAQLMETLHVDFSEVNSQLSVLSDNVKHEFEGFNGVVKNSLESLRTDISSAVSLISEKQQIDFENTRNTIIQRLTASEDSLNKGNLELGTILHDYGNKIYKETISLKDNANFMVNQLTTFSRKQKILLTVITVNVILTVVAIVSSCIL